MIHYQTCSICEALCGLEIEVQDNGIKSIRGNPKDPLSQGFICPKGVALQDIHDDSNRVRTPLRKTASGWQPISWQEALDEVALRLHSIREKYGRRAVGVYAGNPNAHNYGSILMGTLFNKALRAKSRFSATSADQLPHMFAGLMMYGHQLLMPIPDLERTEYLIIMGANPLASNGSIMTAPNMRQRLKGISKKGGKVVVIDPRKTETAKIADAYYGIKPGTDALFLAAFLNTLFRKGLIQNGRWNQFSDGLERVKRAVEGFCPSVVGPICSIDADVIEQTAIEFATTQRAVLYGRLGICTQQFGGLCAWLINVINIVTNHFDEPGGSMFTQPAVDFVGLSGLAGEKGHYNIWQSRVRGLPEFGGELPVSALAEEIDTPGDGQIKAMMTIAGNPVLSAPNSERLSTALESLDFMVSVDMYINATTRHADIILPPTSPLERDHFGLVFHTLAVRNTVKYSQPLFEPAPGAKHDWEILLELAERVTALDGGLKGRLEAKKYSVLKKLGPTAFLKTALRAGEYGKRLNPLKKGLTLKSLMDNPHGVDLGPLRSCLPEKLQNKKKRIQLDPTCLIEDMARLEAWMETAALKQDELFLIGRRHLRSNNSWLHNSNRLKGGSNRCTLLMNPEDARARRIVDKQDVQVRSRVGEVQVQVELSENIMAGVVSLPHGWGHHRDGVQLDIATSEPGVSINALTDEEFLDPLTGNAGFSGVTVQVCRLG